jgi:hypothetical protein
MVILASLGGSSSDLLVVLALGLSGIGMGISTPAMNATVANAVDPSCEEFLSTPLGGEPGQSYRFHLDAMWAQMATGVPTINGYSGYQPAGWTFYPTVIYAPRDEAVLENGLQKWVRKHQLNRSRLCWIKTPADNRGMN